LAQAALMNSIRTQSVARTRDDIALIEAARDYMRLYTDEGSSRTPDPIGNAGAAGSGGACPGVVGDPVPGVV
jgi:hypothetical protein